MFPWQYCQVLNSKVLDSRVLDYAI